MADREPIGANDRRSGDMTDPRPAQGAAHASHDLFVIAAAADRDATTRAAADAQMRDCADCTMLFADLQAVSKGLTDLPRTLPAPRDFRLSPERAAALRRRSWRPSLDGLFRSPSLRPFGNVLATVGFAGLLLTVGLPAVTGGFGSGSAATPAALSDQRQSTGGAAPVPAATAASAPEVVAASGGKTGATTVPVDNAAGSGGSGGASQASAAPNASAAYAYGPAGAPTDRLALNSTDQAIRQDDAAPSTPATPEPLAFLPWLSLGALLVGLTLLALARVGGRARTGS